MKQRTPPPRAPLATLQPYGAKPAGQAEDNINLAPLLDVVGSDVSETQNFKETTSLEILLIHIDMSPYQPRLIFDPMEIDALASSIQTSELNSPITVRAMPNGRYELIAGERRVRAYRTLGKPSIPAYVRLNVSDNEASISALADNEARQDLCDYERAKAFQRNLALPQEHGKPKLTQGLLARMVKVSDSTISRCLSFFSLPSEVIELLDAKPDLFGAKTAEQMASLSKKGHKEVVVQAAKRILNGTSEQAAMNLAAAELNKNEKVPKEAKPLKFNGLHLGNFAAEGRRVIITCLPGVNTQDVIDRLNGISSDAGE